MKQFQTIGKTVEGNEGQKCNYPTRLDTFGCGCQHDCSYCYAKSLLDFRKNWHPENPSVADVRKLRNEIKKLDRATPVRLGGMTDCFQPAEKIHRVTYKTIKLLNTVCEDEDAAYTYWKYNFNHNPDDCCNLRR